MATQHLKHTQPPFVLLENSLHPEQGGLLFQDPHAIITAMHADEVPAAFKQIEGALEEGHHVAGYMTYELGLALEPRLKKLLQEPVPLLWFGVFKDRQMVTYDDISEWLINNQLFDNISETAGKADNQNMELKAAESYTAYKKKFDIVKKNISSGDIYQLNLTFKAKLKNVGNPLKLYAKMRCTQPVEYASVIVTGERTILSASPELFIENKDGWLETKPMKGTLKRGPTTDQDKALSQTLKKDEKSRAENLMIVDLMRNDFSRIANPGSVMVKDLFKVETYPSLHQMISVVRAKLNNDLPLYDQMQALFPPGSITGAPKIRAMELIDELEASPRSLYTGAIGYFAPNKDYVFNVAIRTVELDNYGNGVVGIGSGLVYDSKPKDEYEECLLKMQFLTKSTPEFSLIETLAYDPENGLLYLDEHLARIEKSANYFSYPYDGESIRQGLEQMVQHTRTWLRLRLLLNKSGSYSITPTEMEPPSQNAVWNIAIAKQPMQTNNTFLYHKTTNRNFYDSPRNSAKQTAIDLGKKPIDELIFQNEHGELTEGSFTNLFIKIKGELYTPPITAGLLAGTLRQNMLEKGQVKERSLTIKDLLKAEQIYVGNSVRGLIKAQLIKPHIVN